MQQRLTRTSTSEESKYCQKWWQLSWSKRGRARIRRESKTLLLQEQTTCLTFSLKPLQGRKLTSPCFHRPLLIGTLTQIFLPKIRRAWFKVWVSRADSKLMLLHFLVSCGDSKKIPRRRAIKQRQWQRELRGAHQSQLVGLRAHKLREVWPRVK